MKISNLGAKMIMAVFVCSVFAGLLICSGGEAGAACKNPYDPNNYKSCPDCLGSCSGGVMSNCDPDVNNDNTISVLDLQVILRCVQYKCNPTLFPAKYGCYDLNKDGVINMTDYDIVRKCLGCCLTPSPIK